MLKTLITSHTFLSGLLGTFIVLTMGLIVCAIRRKLLHNRFMREIERTFDTQRNSDTDRIEAERRVRAYEADPVNNATPGTRVTDVVADMWYVEIGNRWYGIEARSRTLSDEYTKCKNRLPSFL